MTNPNPNPNPNPNQVFREPNAMITKSNARVMSLQDGTYP